jgi:hypothetical protein
MSERILTAGPPPCLVVTVHGAFIKVNYTRTYYLIVGYLEIDRFSLTLFEIFSSKEDAIVALVAEQSIVDTISLPQVIV